MKDRHKTEQGKKKRKKQTIQGKEKANTITSLKTLDLAPKKQKSTSGGWGGGNTAVRNELQNRKIS